ncbi:hypothetical protein MMC26_000074 [Xylographa opegraphella]|nr:hypothetical protein [Xylographa opegraphella]
MVKAAKRKLVDKGHSPSTSPKKSKTRKSNRQATILSDANSDESEEDVARLQSQQFLLQTKRVLKQKAVKQKDSHAEQFKTAVEEKKQALLAYLEKRAHESLERRTKAHEALTSILTASLAHHVSPSLKAVPGAGPLPQTQSSPHPLQQKCISLLALSKGLLRSYDTVSRDLARYEASLQVGQHWEGDYQKLQHLLQVGKQVTAERVRAMLVDGDRGPGEAGVGDGAVERDRKKWEDLSGVPGDGGAGETWAVVARKVERGVRRLARCLPDE